MKYPIAPERIVKSSARSSAMTWLAAGIALCTSSVLTAQAQDKPPKTPTAATDSAEKSAGEPSPTGTATPTIYAKAQSLMIPRLVFKEATLEEAVQFLRQKSRELDPDKQGVNIIIPNADPKAERPRITLTLQEVPLAEVLGYIAKASELQLSFEPHAAYFETEAQASAKALVAIPEQPDNATYTKGIRLIIPKLEFREATIREGLDYLRRKSVEIDRDHKGVNIVYQPAPGPEPALTLSLSNIPLDVVLRYIAEMTDMQLTTDEHAYVLAPKKPAK